MNLSGDNKSLGLFFVVALVFVFTAGHQDVLAVGTDHGMLVSHVLLDAAGLRSDWQLDLPIKDDEKVEKMLLFDKYMYVLTDRNYLFCVDRNEGFVRFGMQLATKGLPICQPDFYDGKVWFMVGHRLMILDPYTGVIDQAKRFKISGKSVVYGPVVNSEHIFVAASGSSVFKSGIFFKAISLA